MRAEIVYYKNEGNMVMSEAFECSGLLAFAIELVSEK